MLGESLTGALAPLQNIGKPSGGMESRIARAVIGMLRKERFLDREGGVYDDCIVHARQGDEQLFEDYSDYVATLRGYVIIPVEEYAKLGGR